MLRHRRLSAVMTDCQTGIQRGKRMQTAWYNDVLFYHIYPLGAFDAPKVNEGPATAGNRILQLSDWIPHLEKLGAGARRYATEHFWTWEERVAAEIRAINELLAKGE